MKTKFILLAGILSFFGSLQLSASTSYNFDFTGTNALSTLGGGLSFTVNGLTVTATSFDTANTTGGTALSAGYVGEYQGNGLGVCTVAENTGGCSSAPEHQVDNHAQYDFLLLTFSAPVSLSSVVLKNFGTCSGCGAVDMDMSYWTSPTTFALGSVPTGGQQNDLCGGTSQPSCTASGLTDSLNGTNVRALLIAAAYNPNITSPDSTPDYFKVSSLSVTTPEPASIVLIGSGLLAGAVFGRRRIKKSNK
jgi:hypothetical protein